MVFPSTVMIDGQTQAMQQVSEGVGIVNFGTPDMMNVLFELIPIPDPIESEARGRPMTKNVVMVSICRPGEEKLSKTVRAATEMDKARWPKQWQAFMDNRVHIPEGTPVDFLFPGNPKMAPNMRSSGIHTVEQLADLSDTNCQGIGLGAWEWREKARKYLESANKGVGVHRMQQELDKRDNEIDVLKNKLANMQTVMDRILAREQGVPQTMIPSAPPATYGLVEDALPDPFDPKPVYTGPSDLATPKLPRGRPRKVKV